jgi:hypothetical protein
MIDSPACAASARLFPNFPNGVVAAVMVALLPVLLARAFYWPML